MKHIVGQYEFPGLELAPVRRTVESLNFNRKVDYSAWLQWHTPLSSRGEASTGLQRLAQAIEADAVQAGKLVYTWFGVRSVEGGAK